MKLISLILHWKKEVGRGNYGAVYKAKWRGGDVAVKKLLSVLNDKELVDFQSETALMCKLRPHSNVVQFMGACTKAGDFLAIVTEFMERGSLLAYLKSENQKISHEEMTKIARGIVAGMLHLTSENIIHRDLATRNILLASNLVPKVSDFGMSRFGMNDSSGKTQSTVGPLRWMSPESLSDGIYSEKSDVYSFGVLIYEILTYGALPYPAIVDPVQVASKVVMGKLTLEVPPNSPPLLAEIMVSAIKFKPEDRPTFKSILALFPLNS